MTARQFPKTLMWGAMWSEQLCLYEFFKTWTPVGPSNHEFLTLRRFIWRLVKLETKIKCAKCSPDNCLQPSFWLNHFDLFFDEIWSFEWSPLMSQNRRWRKDSGTPCTTGNNASRKFTNTAFSLAERESVNVFPSWNSKKTSIFWN